MLIHNQLKCKTDPRRPKLLKVSEDKNLKNCNAQTKYRMHVKTPKAKLI